MRRRLIIAIACVAAVAVVLLALPLAVVLRRDFRNQELLRLQRDTIAATRTIDLGVSRRDPIELPASTDRLAVYDSAGRRVGGRGPAHADALVRRSLHMQSPADGTSDGNLVAAVPLLAGERISGALRAQRSDAGAAGDTRGAWLALTGLAGIVIALAALAASVLGRHLARPLEQLACAARRLGDGDFAARAPRGGIPETDQVAGALDDTAERLGDLVARERAFSADASHQLRTPLAALRLELEALELRDGAAPELQSALAQVDRLQSTIDTLLTVARDAPRSSPHTDLAVALHELEKRWHGPLAADARPLRLLRRADHTVARVAPTVVPEILDVLLDNAHRHGTGPVTITVRTYGGWLAIDVSDQGGGFADDGANIFTRRPPSRDGHGIGLGLAQTLAHAEGGRLTLTRASPPTLTLWLPRAPDPARVQETPRLH